MTQHVAFLTLEKDHFRDFGQFLAEAIDPAFFTDPSNPVTVSIRGPLLGGQEQIERGARGALFTDGTDLGIRPLEHYHYGTLLSTNQPIEISSVDTLQASEEINYELSRPDDLDVEDISSDAVLDQFMKQRQFGGLAFVYNSDSFGEKNAGIDIRVEKKNGEALTRGARALQDAASGELVQTFHNMSDMGGAFDVGYVHIRVRDPRLANSPRFQAAMSSLGAQREVPIYGLNIRAARPQ